MARTKSLVRYFGSPKFLKRAIDFIRTVDVPPDMDQINDRLFKINEHNKRIEAQKKNSKKA